MVGGPQEVQAACDGAIAALGGAFAESAVVGSREQWAAAVGSLQHVINVATAAQDAAITRLAAIEPEFLEDGTEVESHRALGHVALDSPAILSGVLAVSALHAERRVVSAGRLAADGPEGTDSASGLGGLHTAMRDGRLDAYRAWVVAEELEEAPPQVAESVVAALEAHFENEDGAHLRRRCRRVLARISPDLLIQRAKRARAESSLRRWVDEPGVDRWEGTFPSDEAARGWAAVDALARRYVADQVCSTIERARAKALMDLIAGNATIETVITLTVPAEVVPSSGEGCTGATESQVAQQVPTAGAPGENDLVEVTGPAGTQPVLVSRQWLVATVEQQRAADPGKVRSAVCHPVTGALIDTDVGAGVGAAEGDLPAPRHETADALGSESYRPPRRLARRVRARDRRCRFPGCSVAAVFCDLDHVRPWPAGRTALDNLICLCRRHHRIKQRPGWRVVLAADGTVTWTDPTGRTRATAPVDALHPTVLRDGDTDPAQAHDPSRSAAGTASATASRARTEFGDGPHSYLEFQHEHLAAAASRASTTASRDDRGLHRIELLPALHRTRLRHLQPACCHRASRNPQPRARPRHHDHDPPPF